MLGHLDNPSLEFEQDQLFVKVLRKGGVVRPKADNGLWALALLRHLSQSGDKLELGETAEEGWVHRAPRSLCGWHPPPLHVAAGHGSNGDIGYQVLVLTGGADHCFSSFPWGSLKDKRM